MTTKPTEKQIQQATLLISVLVGFLALAGILASTEREIVIQNHNPPRAIVVRLPAGRHGSVAETRIVTAYSSEVGQTDSTPFLTASGQRVRDGIIACPRHLPFGTMVEIQGKVFICEDRMNIRYTNNYDIWMESKTEALAWGRRNVEVIIK